MALSRWVFHALIVGFAFSSHVAFSADTNKQKDQLRWMMRIQEASTTQPIVDYCRNNAPDSAKALDAGYVNYTRLMETARETWIQTLSEAELAKAPTANDLKEASAKIREISALLIASVRTHDAQRYCPALAARLSAFTPETAAKSIADAQAKINAARDRLKH